MFEITSLAQDLLESSGVEGLRYLYQKKGL